MDDNAKEHAKLHGLFVECCEGKSFTTLRTSERRNGIHFWVKPKHEYEGKTTVRYQGMLTGLMTPSWGEEMQNGTKDFNSHFMEVYLSWESQIATYELQRGRPLDGSRGHAPRSWRCEDSS
eukprot:5367946-Amphidinium_carterae.1